MITRHHRRRSARRHLSFLGHLMTRLKPDDTIPPNPSMKKESGRRPKAYSQADRLARMMRTLARRAVTITDLADEFQVTRRQVYRDLDRIQEEGHPLTQSDGSGEKTWQLPLGYKGLPPITVSPYELMSLHLAKSHLGYLKGTPFAEDLDGVISKIESGLPAKTVNHLERIVQVFSPLQRPFRFYNKQKAILSDLRKALLLQRRIKLDYKKVDADKARPYIADPYGLVLHQNGLYIVGLSQETGALRTFAVERIKSVTMTDEPFDIPATFSLTDRSHRLFGVMDKPSQHVQIEFSSDVAYMLKERQWHPTQTIQSNKGGSLVLTMTTGGLEEVASWVLSWGDKAKVLAPSELRAMVAEELIAAARQYQ